MRCRNKTSARLQRGLPLLAGLGLLVILSACANVSSTPGRGLSGNNLLLIQCNGMAMTQCHQQAARACPAGYRTLDVRDDTDPDDPVRRKAEKSIAVECLGYQAAVRANPTHDDVVKSGVFSVDRPAD